jgi:hypothetical protein
VNKSSYLPYAKEINVYYPICSTQESISSLRGRIKVHKTS